LWSKDLLDVNTNSVPLASCLNKDANGIIVMTRGCPKGKFPVGEGSLALWEIGIDGTTTRTEPKDVNGSRVRTNGDSVGVGGCAMISNNFGDILTVGILNKSGEKRQKIAIVSKADKAKMTLTPNSIESHSIMKTIALQDNTFILIGKRDKDGLCIRIDGQGRIIKEKLFDIGDAEIFSGIDRAKSNGSTLAIVGSSEKFSMKDYRQNYAKSFVLIYDSNLNLAREDYFGDTNSVSMFSLLLRPKVCSLNNGNIVVLYKKESANPNKTLLATRCYTKELKLLWDKEIFSADKMPFAMDITSRDSDGFTIGIISYIVQQSNNLLLDSFDNEGKKINSYSIKGIITLRGFNLMHIGDKVIAVFEEGTAETGNPEGTMKARVIALD
jgi:hypothetical protein